jgi:putative membrane protein
VLYLFFKWLHFVAVISWMAGILYLFRLYVNHAEKGQSPEVHEVLSGMEHRLYKYITMPAMLVSFAAGISMIVLNPGVVGGWFHVKALCLLGLAGMTGYAGGLRRKFAARAPGLPTAKTLRIMNEVPTLLMMIIIAMAVFRPF